METLRSALTAAAEGLGWTVRSHLPVGVRLRGGRLHRRRSAPADAVTTAATAPSTNGASTRRVPSGSSSPSASSAFTVRTALPRSVRMATPAPRSTVAAAAAISSELVPSPPSSVPPAAATGTGVAAAREPLGQLGHGLGDRPRCARPARSPTSFVVTHRPASAVSASAANSSADEVAPGILVPDAALTEIARPALAGLQRRRRQRALARRRSRAAAKPPSPSASTAGTSASIMVLSPGAAPPSAMTASTPGPQRVGELLPRSPRRRPPAPCRCGAAACRTAAPTRRRRSRSAAVRRG